MHRADSIGTTSGFLKARGYANFGTVDILTATPNPFDATHASISGGGLGLLPWYIHPASADNNMTHVLTASNATAAPGTVSESSVLESSGVPTGGLVLAPSASPAQPLSGVSPDALPIPATASG